MRFIIDDSKPSDSIDSHWTETSYDGEPDSVVPEIPSHWHKFHDEHMQVTKGRVEFTAEGKTVILTPDDPQLTIPRWHVHSLRFLKGEAASFNEKTTPAGDFKEQFFENIFDDSSFSLINTLRGCWYGDTYLALPGGIKLLDQAFTLTGGALAAFFFPQKHKGMAAESVPKQGEAARL